MLAVLERRTDADGQFEYFTRWADGTSDWRLVDSFVGDDGTTEINWLNFASVEDLTAAFGRFTKEQLKVIISNRVFA